MGEEFITGITDLVSGEKDPRNLMVIFSMLKVVMVEWDIANHVEVSASTHVLLRITAYTSNRLCSIPFSAIFP